MTTVELYQKLLRNTSYSDLSGVPIEDQMHYIDALNRALAFYYSAAPAIYRRTTVSTLILEPEEVSITVTNAEHTASGSPFSDRHRGCSIVIEGDSLPNEILDADTLLNAYRGDTGTRTATIYYDAIPIIDQDIERIITDPIIVDTGAYLRKDPKLPEPSRWREIWRVRNTIVTGNPRFYTALYVGNSQGADHTVILRLDPAPVSELTIQFDALLRPTRLSIGSFATPATLQPADSLCDLLLVPLAEANLIASPIWAGGDAQTRKIADDGKMAEQGVKSLTPYLTTPNHTLETPDGY